MTITADAPTRDTAGTERPSRANFFSRVAFGAGTQPRWVRPAVLALLAFTAVLYLWGLGSAGWAPPAGSAPRPRAGEEIVLTVIVLVASPGQRTEAQQQVSTGPRAPRPVPLAPRLTAAEITAHAAFVARMGEKALWHRYLPAGGAP